MRAVVAWRSVGRTASALRQFDVLSEKSSVDAGAVVWKFGAVCHFHTIFKIEASDAKGFGLAFELRPEAESRLLSGAEVCSINGLAQPAGTTAGRIRCHMAQRRAHTSKLRCFMLAPNVALDVCTGACKEVVTRDRFLLAMGVKVSAEAPVQPEIERPLLQAPLHVVGDVGLVGPRLGVEEGEAHRQAHVAQPAQPAALETRVTKGLWKGCIKEKFNAKTLLGCLRLWRVARCRSPCSEVASMVFDVCLSAPAALELKQKLASGDLRLPGYGALRWANIKLDLMSMFWRRKQFDAHSVTSYLYIDASPQGGYNYLVARVDEIMPPPPPPAHSSAEIDLNWISAGASPPAASWFALSWGMARQAPCTSC